MSKEQVENHLFSPGPKRILSLDGGGVHGLATLGMLTRVESLLASRSANPAEFKLSDYFDLIGGTSTGGVIATLLALGYRTDNIIDLYMKFCPRIFGKRRTRNLFLMGSKFDSRKFDEVVNETFDDILRNSGEEKLLKDRKEPTLSSRLLTTGLAIFAKRIDKPSVWVFVNNPRSKYWSDESPHWKAFFEGKDQKFYANANYSLRDIVKASASAPYYFDAVELEIDTKQRGMFLDGGVSPHNNPSLELFLMTAMKSFGGGDNPDGLSPFGFSWPTGKKNIFMLSLGSGSWREIKTPEEYRDLLLPNKTITALSSIIRDCQISATTWMQSVADVTRGTFINENLGVMAGLRIVDEPLLTFRRVNPKFERDWLKELDPRFAISDNKLAELREFDRANKDGKTMKLLLNIGEATGERDVSEEDFPVAFDLPDWPGYTAPLKRKFMVGVTGHRLNRLPEGSGAQIYADIKRALAMIEAQWPDRQYVLLSGLAEGADRYAADAVLAHDKWKLEAILPFSKDRYLKDFESSESRTEFLRLLDASARIIELTSGDRFQDAADAYAELGDELVDRCDVMIAVWDRKQADGKGGTADVATASSAAQIPVFLIDPVGSEAPALLQL